MKHLLGVLFITAIILGVGSAVAGGSWSHTVSHRYSGNTSIKVTEPKGFAVEVTVGEEVKKDTIPAIITLPDEDAFVPVVVRAQDGATWAEKVEVRSKQQTSLEVSYTPSAQPQKSKNSRSYIGDLATLAERSCGGQWRGRATKFEFFDHDGGKSMGSFQFKGDGAKSIEITGGSYDVRLFIKYQDAFSYSDTITVNVAKDGWTLAFACKNSRTPRLMFQ